MYAASVIIPVYKAEKTLRRCVESLVFGQEKNLEIILVDDCSPDASWELCEALNKEYDNVFCYRNAANKGVSFTRNKGLKHATAPFVLFVDSDDWVSSEYAAQLIRSAVDNPNYLTVCGYAYIDLIAKIRKKFSCAISESNRVRLNTAFTILDNILLQQLWNKAFRLDVIRTGKISFNESLAMGEDFEFVLDYIEAARPQGFALIQAPLYYYIRASKSSLMSEWSTQSVDHGYKQYERLYELCGDRSEYMRETLEEHKNSLKFNLAYHIVRDEAHSAKEQIERLGKLMSQGDAVNYYRRQIIPKVKESIAELLTKIRVLYKRISGKLTRVLIENRINKANKELKVKDVSIISQNCIGGVLYHDLGMQFLSPTINAFIPEPGFVKLALNLRHYMGQELVVRWGEEYPIGMLDDVEIHFMHYETCKEAKESWERRKARINWDKILILGTDRDGFDDYVYEQWKQIKYPKVLFTAHTEFTEDAVYYPEYESDGQIGDLIPDRKFYRNQRLIGKISELCAISKRNEYGGQQQ